MVYVSFVIDENGNVTDVSTTKQTKRLGYGCEEEAIRVIKNGPKWTPAKKDEQHVKATLFFPVKFRL